MPVDLEASSWSAKEVVEIASWSAKEVVEIAST
jgi:hypothetical protein